MKQMNDWLYTLRSLSCRFRSCNNTPNRSNGSRGRSIRNFCSISSINPGKSKRAKKSFSISSLLITTNEIDHLLACHHPYIYRFIHTALFLHRTNGWAVPPPHRSPRLYTSGSFIYYHQHHSNNHHGMQSFLCPISSYIIACRASTTRHYMIELLDYYMVWLVIGSAIARNLQ